MRLLRSQITLFEEHSQVERGACSWSKDLTVEVAGHGVVSHAGSAVLRLLADNTGLTGVLSRALRAARVHPGSRPRPRTGGYAVCIADGGRVLSDLATLRDQEELYGPVASDPTLWRALEEIGAEHGRGSPPRERRSASGCGR